MSAWGASRSRIPERRDSYPERDGRQRTLDLRVRGPIGSLVRMPSIASVTMWEGHDQGSSAPSASPSSSHLASGVRVANRYLVGAPIGRGGMATAYSACDERLQRAVCIKLLRSALPTTNATGDLDVATYAHFVQ